MNEKSHRSQCPINYSLEILGDKWSFLVIRDMLMFGKQSFNEFLESEESISTNILADRLVRLTEYGIISSRPCEDNWKKKIYFLTEKGKGLLPIILEMASWAVKYQENTALPAEFIKRFHEDRENLLNSILAEVKQ